VSGFGGCQNNMKLPLDQIKLSKVEVTIEDIFTALEKNNQNTVESLH